MNTNILVTALVTILSLTSFSSVAHAGVIVRDLKLKSASLDYPPGPYAFPPGPYAFPSAPFVQGDGVIIRD